MECGFFSIGSIIIGVLLGWALEWLFVTFVQPQDKKAKTPNASSNLAQAEFKALKQTANEVVQLKEQLFAVTRERDALLAQATKA